MKYADSLHISEARLDYAIRLAGSASSGGATGCPCFLRKAAAFLKMAWMVPFGSVGPDQRRLQPASIAQAIRAVSPPRRRHRAPGAVSSFESHDEGLGGCGRFPSSSAQARFAVRICPFSDGSDAHLR